MEPKRMETLPSPLIQLQTWLTQSESVVSMLSCYLVRSYELTIYFFFFFVQQTSLPAPCWVLREREGAAQPGDRISPPAETGNKSNSLIGCVSSWQVWVILILQKNLDLWAVGEKSPVSLCLIHPSSRYTVFLLVTLERYYSTGRLCKHQRGHYQMEIWRHQRDNRERVLSTEGCASQYALLGLLVPDVSWEQSVQGTNPREIKYSEGLILKEICWNYQLWSIQEINLKLCHKNSTWKKCKCNIISINRKESLYWHLRKL